MESKKIASTFKATLNAGITASIFASFICQALPGHSSTSLHDQTAVAVTIYNKNLALIKDQRTIVLDKGMSRLVFKDVSAKMRPETALLRSLNQVDLNVIEQSFNFDLLTPDTLLEKHLGQTISIATINPVTGKETVRQGTVLSTHKGTVVNIDGQIVTNPRGRFIFDKIPEDLYVKPTLTMQLNNNISTSQSVELSYLSSGLSWKTDYVAELGSDDKKIDLTGWVTLKNQSGASYENAKLQLVAGDINIAKNKLNNIARNELISFSASSVHPQMKEESLLEYYLYTLDRPITIPNQQTKQMVLLAVKDIPVKMEFLLQGQNNDYISSYNNLNRTIKANVILEFENKTKDGMGVPLPKGIIRIYKQDRSGRAQFIGEDNIDHTQTGKVTRLKLGQAFDVTANKKRTEFKKQRDVISKNKNTYSGTYEIRLYNAKKKTVTVIVREPIPGDWKILEETHRSKKINANTAEWRIAVPAKANKVLKYKTMVYY